MTSTTLEGRSVPDIALALDAEGQLGVVRMPEGAANAELQLLDRETLAPQRSPVQIDDRVPARARRLSLAADPAVPGRFLVVHEPAQSEDLFVTRLGLCE